MSAHLEIFLPNDFKLSAQQAVERWDAGKSLWSIEMGGLGPSYEQAIQVAAIEMLREALAAADPAMVPEAFTKVCESVISKHNDALGGLSGAQFSVAMNLAYMAFTHGWTGMIENAKEKGLGDRLIQIDDRWPRVKEGATSHA